VAIGVWRCDSNSSIRLVGIEFAGSLFNGVQRTEQLECFEAWVLKEQGKMVA
jgi:hypothetical protein